jgi:proton-translocating NADH-quinone oxidoreductase chain M
MLVLNLGICLAIVSLLLGKQVYKIALTYSLVIFLYSLILVTKIHANIANFVGSQIGQFNFWNITLNYTTGLQGLSLLFIILSTFLIIVCVLSSATIKYRQRLFFILLFLTEFALVNVFSVTEILYFYIFFEVVLIPMFLIIGIYGSRQEKIAAAYQFFIYTLIGSLAMLISIIFILMVVGSTNIWLIKAYAFSPLLERILWLAFFASFAVKIPMFPFHLWLPKAHVEAPTAGSVLLAGALLKLGSYGFLRFSLFLFPNGTEYFRPFIVVLALLGIIYSSFTILRQIDLKRIVAYSSVSHMSFVIAGCFGGTNISLNGAILLMLAHGLVSGGLFLCVGYLYDRYKSRNLWYYRGLASIMPIYAIMFFILILANLGFPLTLNFVSEFLILAGIMELNLVTATLSGIGIFFAGVAGFWVFTRIFFGNFAHHNGKYHILYYYDLTLREACSLLPLILLTIYLGGNPNIFLDIIVFDLTLWGI